MKKLRTALVGLGKVAHLHAKVLSDEPRSEFVAVCGRNAERAQTFASQYGVACFCDVDDMIAQAGVEAICVCTPHPAHAAPAIVAARAGVHLLIEKPLATSLTDCDAIIAAAQTSGSVVGVVSQRRFYPSCLRIRRALDRGALGRPVLANATIFGWRDEAYYRSDPWRGTWAGEGGGILVNQAPHQLDLLLWYMGEVEEVSGFWGNLNHPYIQVEDTAVAAVRFKSGALGSILVSNSQNPAINARVSIHGVNGSSIGVQTDGGAMFIAGMSTIAEAPFNDLWTIPGEEHLAAPWRVEDEALFRSVDPQTHYHRLQIRDFLDAILQKRAPAVTAQDGRRTVELFTAIYRAGSQGRAIRFPLPSDGPGPGESDRSIAKTR